MSDRLMGALTFTFYSVGLYFCIQTAIMITDYYYLVLLNW